MHRYFQISSYTSDKHYEMTHDVSENYNKLLDAFWDSDLAKAFNKNNLHEKFIGLKTKILFKLTTPYRILLKL